MTTAKSPLQPSAFIVGLLAEQPRETLLAEHKRLIEELEDHKAVVRLADKLLAR